MHGKLEKIEMHEAGRLSKKRIMCEGARPLLWSLPRLVPATWPRLVYAARFGLCTRWLRERWVCRASGEKGVREWFYCAFIAAFRFLWCNLTFHEDYSLIVGKELHVFSPSLYRLWGLSMYGWRDVLATAHTGVCLPASSHLCDLIFMHTFLMHLKLLT